MDREIMQLALEHAQETYLRYASCPTTHPAAYGLAIHTLMYLITVDARTACLLFPEPTCCHSN